jgi:hypothetical protein
MSSALSPRETEDADLRQAMVDSLQTTSSDRQGMREHNTTDGATTTSTESARTPNNDYDAIKCLTQNTDLRLGNEFDPINDPLGDTLVYIGVPPPSLRQTREEQAYMTKHFDRFFVLQSSTLKALGSTTFERLLGPNACIRAEKRFKRLSAYKKLHASILTRIKFHIDLRPPSEDDEAVLLITDLTCSHGILNWHQAEDFFHLIPGAIAGTDYFDGPSNPYYVELKQTKSQTAEPRVSSPAAEYCPLRHHSGLERLLNAIIGNDPKLDSAPKMWVFFALAQYLDCSHHDSVRKWILAWLWQPNNNNFVQSNPEAAYRIGLGCQSQDLARDAFAILVGEKALMDVSHQLCGTISSTETSIHGRPFEILDDDERSRVGHAASSLVQRVCTTLQDLLCKYDWMQESSEFKRLLTMETQHPAQLQILQFAQNAVGQFVRYRLYAMLVDGLDSARDTLHPRPDAKLPHARYKLDLTRVYKELPYLARPFTRSFWQSMYNIRLSADEAEASIPFSISAFRKALEQQDLILGLGLKLPDYWVVSHLSRRIEMVNDIIRDQEPARQLAIRAKPQGVRSYGMTSLAPQPLRKRYTMKRMSNDWAIESEREVVVPQTPSPTTTAGQPSFRNEQQQEATSEMPASPTKRRKLSSGLLTLEPFPQIGEAVAPKHDSPGSQATEGYSTSIQLGAGPSLMGKWPSPTTPAFDSVKGVNGGHELTSTTTSESKAASTRASQATEGEVGLVSATRQNASTGEDASWTHSRVGNESAVQPWVTPFFAEDQSQPGETQHEIDDSGSNAATRGMDAMFAVPGLPETESQDDVERWDPPLLDVYPTGNDTGVGKAETPDIWADPWWKDPEPSAPTRRPVQQFSNTNTAPSTRFRPEFEALGPGKYINLEHMLQQLGQVIRQRAMDLLYPTHIFHDSSSLPVDLIDHIFSLGDDEWKFLPLTVGGFDDGSGGVFDEAIPNLEVGGFRGGKRGIGKDTGPTSQSESGSSIFDDIASEAVSTVGKASKIATDGTETVKSYDESESDTGFDYTDLYNEVQQLKVEQGAQVVDNGGDFGNAERHDEKSDVSTIMGAGSDVQGEFFGEDDEEDQPAIDAEETTQSEVPNAHAARVTDESDEDSDMEIIHAASL